MIDELDQYLFCRKLWKLMMEQAKGNTPLDLVKIV